MRVSLLFTVLCSGYATECFQTCFDCDVAEDHPCYNKCGYPREKSEAEARQIFPGYVATECEVGLDYCIYLEFYNERQNGTVFNLAQPWGCLSQFHYSTENIQGMSSLDLGSVKLSRGMNIFSCEGDFCNSPPPSIRCDASQSKNYTSLTGTNDIRTNNCFVGGGLKNFEMIAFNKLRGRIVSGQILGGGCVQEENLLQHDSEDPCLLGWINNCIGSDEPGQLDFEQCGADNNLPTFSPTVRVQQQPTLEETNFEEDPNSTLRQMLVIIVTILSVLSAVVVGYLVYFTKNNQFTESPKVTADGSGNPIVAREASEGTLPVARALSESEHGNRQTVEEVPVNNPVSEISSVSSLRKSASDCFEITIGALDL